MKVSAEFREVMSTEKIDVALIREPFVWKGKVCGLGNGTLLYKKDSEDTMGVRSSK